MTNLNGNWSNIKARYLSDLQNRDHNVLDNRDAPHAHPASAIDGLNKLIPSIPFISSGGYSPGGANFTSISAASVSPNEADVQCRIEQNGTLRKLRIFVNFNSLIQDLIVTIRKNGSNTPVTLTVGALSTGEFVDNIHTVDVVQGDLVDYLATSTDLIGAAGVVVIQCEFIAR